MPTTSTSSPCSTPKSCADVVDRGHEAEVALHNSRFANTLQLMLKPQDVVALVYLSLHDEP
jgi:hypothetical protein